MRPRKPEHWEANPREVCCSECGDLFVTTNWKAAKCPGCRSWRGLSSYIKARLVIAEAKLKERLDRTVKVFTPEEIRQLKGG